MQLNSTGSRARSANSGSGARGRKIKNLSLSLSLCVCVCVCVCVCQDCSEKEMTLGCLRRCFIPHSLSLALLHVHVGLLSSFCTAPGFDQSWQAASIMLCRVSSPQCPSLSSRPNLQISLSPRYDAFAVWWVVWYHVPDPAVMLLGDDSWTMFLLYISCQGYIFLWKQSCRKVFVKNYILKRHTEIKELFIKHGKCVGMNTFAHLNADNCQKTFSSSL